MTVDPAMEQLLSAALALPDEDRLQIAEALIVSLQPADRPPFDESWRDTIKRRSEELRTGGVIPVVAAKLGKAKVTRPMKLKILVHAAEEGGYWAEVPALPGCFSEGETLEEVRANIREAAEGWLTVASERHGVEKSADVQEIEL
jgi:predicted RNase H-like HicB family nuclease